MSLAFTPEASAEVPSQETLGELERRVVASKTCEDPCAVATSMTLTIDDRELLMRAEVHAQGDAGWYLPGPSNVARIRDVEVDGVRTDQLRRSKNGMIAVRLTRGRHVVVVRAQLPTVRLSLSAFLQSDALDTLFETILYSIGGSFSQPVIDGGRRGAEVDRAEAAQLEAFYTYSNTFVTAMGEVESAMVAESFQGSFIGQLELQRDRAQVSLDLSRERYVNGSGDFLRVLTSLQSLQALEQSLIDSRRQQLTNRITLCRALGGSWTKGLEAPADLKDFKKNTERKDEEAAQ